jgi:hypothetical protein
MNKITKLKSPKTAKPITPVQEALQITWRLKGNLKSARIAYLKIGALLVQVRDKKLYAELKHPDMEDYAEKRLQLGRSSLYKYLQVYDWVSKFYPEWLQPKPKGFIPELYDVADLMEIEDRLNGKNLSPQKRAKLQTLKGKALSGELKTAELKELSIGSAKKVYRGSRRKL